MASRKRKSNSINVSSAASEFHLPCKSSWKEGEENDHGVRFNQTESFVPSTLRHQFHSHQFQQAKGFGEVGLISGSNVSKSSLFREPSLLSNMPAGETQGPHSKNQEELLSETVPEDQTRSWDKDNNFPDTVPVGIRSLSSEFTRPDGNDFRARDNPKEVNELEKSFQQTQSGQFLNNFSAMKLPHGQIDSLGVSGQAGKVQRQSELHSVSSTATVPLDVSSELKTVTKSEASVANGNNVSIGVEHGHLQKLNPALAQKNGKNISPRKATSMAAEKLWEGSIQLNSSTTVSAVAFFKSGEKLLDVNWSEFVEVKGKVRLEAFEKYIQDLPRSRTRGLMVISICWKEGSSESGLKGMKEVAKGYRKGERVGLARLSPGVDVYLCPRSNTIITILAKHGFFKGKAAIEDKSELLIGCVVWRKEQITVGPSTKRSEKKNKSLQKQLPVSRSDTSSNQQYGGRSSSFVPPMQDSKPLAVVETSSVVENVTVGESKNGSIGKPISHINLSPTTLVSKVPSSPAPQQNSSYSCLPFDGFKEQQLDIDAAPTRSSESEYPKASIEPQKSIISVPSNATMGRICREDIDDLPEFDFGNRGNSSTISVSNPLDASAVNKRLQHEGNNNSNYMMPPVVPAIHSVSVADTRSRNSSVHQLSSIFNKETPEYKSIAHNSNPVLVRQNNEGSQSLQTSSPDPVPVDACTFASSNVAFDRLGKKNFFDDGDDMPEWIPPVLEKPSSAESKEPPRAIPYSSSSSIGTSVQPLPPRFPASPVPECSSQAFQPSFRPPPNLKIPPPVPSKYGASSLTGFTFTQMLNPPTRPPAIPRPVLPADKLGSRP